MDKETRVLYFVYCEAVENKALPNGKQQTNIMNPLQFIGLKYLPTGFSYSICFSIQGFDIERQNELQIVLKNEQNEIVNDTGKIILPAVDEKANVSLPENYRGMQMTIDFRNVSFEKEGMHMSELWFNDKKLGEYPIGVLKVGE